MVVNEWVCRVCASCQVKNVYVCVINVSKKRGRSKKEKANQKEFKSMSNKPNDDDEKKRERVGKTVIQRMCGYVCMYSTNHMCCTR